MKAIKTKITTNEFINYVPDGTAVTHLIHDFKIQRNINYIHVLYTYGPWNNTKNLDIFQYFTKPDLKALKAKKIFLLFDITTEGFSPTKQCPLFPVLYYNCEKYNVDPEQIIYVSSNLLDEDNIIAYTKHKRLKPFHILAFPAFQHIFLKPEKDAIKILEHQKKFTTRYFTDKYFSSLSRNLRGHRAIAHFLLFYSPIFDKALTSHDRVTEIFQCILGDLRQVGTDKQIKRWMKCLPFTIDRDDFSRNWAIDTPYEKLYQQTIFHVVNETEVNDFDNTAMFYSEKTFRPIKCMMPFIIYGQPNTNKYLEKLGYKLYHDWFDYSFDEIRDPIERYRSIVKMLTEVCNMLDKMSVQEKIDWRFKNQELLVHNFNNMFDNELTKKKFNNFLKQYENNR